jgi:very-short-patch-repair endonuclease
MMVDLVHPDVKLAIEVDGPSHKHRVQKARDRWKERELQRRGWFVLRFSNQEIDTGLSRVVKTIRSTISKLKGTTTSTLTES